MGWGGWGMSRLNFLHVTYRLLVPAQSPEADRSQLYSPLYSLHCLQDNVHLAVNTCLGYSRTLRVPAPVPYQVRVRKSVNLIVRA